MTKSRNQNITLVLLSVTAVILTAMLVASYCNTQTPAAAGYTAVGRYDWIICPYRLSSDRDLMCVVDQVTRKLTVYSVNSTTNTMETVCTQNLERDFQK